LRIDTKVEEVDIEDWQKSGWQKLRGKMARETMPETAFVEVMEIDFTTDGKDGAYVFEVDCGDQPEGPWAGAVEIHWIEHVVVYSKPWTSYPAPGVEDIAELVVDGVNLSAKNGWIWFVHPIYFAEQLLRVHLSQPIKEEMAYCEGLPEDLPAPDHQLVLLQRGRSLAGMRRICLESDGPEDICVYSDRVSVQVDNPVQVATLFKEVI
jgi:hypothetical protein